MARIVINCFFVVLSTIFFSSCKDNNMNVSTPPPLSSNLIGKWEWTKTVDKSGEIITPQTAGYSKSISYGNSDKVNGNYLYLTERDEAPMVLKQNNDFGKAELLGDTLNITTQFENRYIEFFLIKNSDKADSSNKRNTLVI